MKLFAVGLLIAVLSASVNGGGDPFAVCDLPSDPGYRCEEGAESVLFYYDGFTGFCEEFSYLGCGGNGNRFNNTTDCETFCIIQGDAKPTTT